MFSPYFFLAAGVNTKRVENRALKGRFDGAVGSIGLRAVRSRAARTGQVGGFAHLTLSDASPMRANMPPTIQKRTAILVSARPWY